MTASQICTACGQLAISALDSPAPHLKCNHCKGMGLPSASAKMLLLEIAHIPPPVVGEAVRNATESPQKCFACQKQCSTLSLEQQNCQFCQSCGSLWLTQGSMNALSHGKWTEKELLNEQVSPNPASFDIGLSTNSTAKIALEPLAVALASSDKSNPTVQPPSNSPAPSTKKILSLSRAAPSPSLTHKRSFTVEGTGGKNRAPLSPTSKMALAAGSIVVAVALAFALLLFFTAPPTPESSVELTPEMLAQKYEVYFMNSSFGGQTLNWWTNALQESHATGSKPNPSRYQNLLHRIQLLGLIVHKSKNISDAGEVRIGSALLTTLARHLDEK